MGSKPVAGNKPVVGNKPVAGRKPLHRAVKAHPHKKPANTSVGLWSVQGVAILTLLAALTALILISVGKQGQRKGQSFWFGLGLSLLGNPVMVSLCIAFLRPTNHIEQDLERYQHNTWWWRIGLVLMYLLPFLYLAVTMVLLFAFFFGFLSLLSRGPLHSQIQAVLGWALKKAMGG